MKRKKNVVLISIIVLFAIAFLCACAYVVIKGVLNRENRNEYNNIASSYAGELSQSQSSTEITAPTEIDIKKAENPDAELSDEDLEDVAGGSLLGACLILVYVVTPCVIALGIHVDNQTNGRW